MCLSPELSAFDAKSTDSIGYPEQKGGPIGRCRVDLDRSFLLYQYRIYLQIFVSTLGKIDEN